MGLQGQGRRELSECLCVYMYLTLVSHGLLPPVSQSQYCHCFPDKSPNQALCFDTRHFALLVTQWLSFKMLTESALLPSSQCPKLLAALAVPLSSKVQNWTWEYIKQRGWLISQEYFH